MMSEGNSTSPAFNSTYTVTAKTCNKVAQLKDHVLPRARWGLSCCRTHPVGAQIVRGEYHHHRKTHIGALLEFLDYGAPFAGSWFNTMVFI